MFPTNLFDGIKTLLLHNYTSNLFHFISSDTGPDRDIKPFLGKINIQTAARIA